MPSPVAEAFAALHRAAATAPVAWTPAGSLDRASLAVAAARLARQLDVADGARVAISVRDGCTFLSAVLAVWQRDGCVILLDAADPRAPRLDLARRLGAAAVITDEPALRTIPLDGGESAGPFAAIKLTSGSTDQPRGIGVSAAALLADADQVERSMGIDGGDRVLAAVPMSFSYGVGNLLVPALCRGRELVLPDHRHPSGLLNALRAGAPTVLPAVPALLRALVQRARELPRSLRLVVSAGALLPPGVAAAFRTRFRLPVHAFYGATEAGGICYDRSGRAAEVGTVGSPVDGVAVTLAADGRVSARSAAVGEALDGDGPRHGVFATGDLAEWRDGALLLLGRAGEVFDVGGHKVHPREIESVIAELASVEEVVVVPGRDRDGRAACAALVAARDVDEMAVRRHCNARLPAAKVPRCVVVMRELPRSPRGKLLRDDVERLLARADSGVGG